MSVSNPRGEPEEKYEPVLDRAQLHRVCLTRKFGKPIWQHSSLEEFARAMRDAVQAHDILSSHGILLHCDISGGSILIDKDTSYEAQGTFLKAQVCDPQKASGFLSDWRSAWFPQDVLRDVATDGAEPRPEPDSSMEVTPDDMMTTGTPIFLATDILLGLKYKMKTLRTREHDLESFEWVILFTIYEHSIERAHNGPNREAAKERLAWLTEEFQNIFPAGIDPPALADKRTFLLDWPKHPAMSHFRNIQGLLSFVKDVVGSEELHGVLLDIWLDLTYRNLALSARVEGPVVRPGSFFHNKNAAVFVLPECMGHRDLKHHACTGALRAVDPKPELFKFQLDPPMLNGPDPNPKPWPNKPATTPSPSWIRFCLSYRAYIALIIWIPATDPSAGRARAGDIERERSEACLPRVFDDFEQRRLLQV